MDVCKPVSPWLEVASLEIKSLRSAVQTAKQEAVAAKVGQCRLTLSNPR